MKVCPKTNLVKLGVCIAVLLWSDREKNVSFSLKGGVWVHSVVVHHDE